MEFKRLKIPDVILIEPPSFEDDRGFFYESYNKKEFDKIVGEEINFVQDNFSCSSSGVLRGIHYQEYPFSQGKLVRVSKGKVFDVAIDLREESPFYLSWVSAELSDENKRQLWIPEGFGHAFLTLSDEAHFNYKTTNFYNPSFEKTIIWNDSKIGIKWPEVENLNISEKDLKGEHLV